MTSSSPRAPSPPRASIAPWMRRDASSTSTESSNSTFFSAHSNTSTDLTSLTCSTRSAEGSAAEKAQAAWAAGNGRLLGAGHRAGSEGGREGQYEVSVAVEARAAGCG